jgi:predicted dehydrogenase
MALRLGLVGRGRWGRNIERTLLSLPDVSLTIIGRNERPSGLDGVLIATPSATHAALALPYIDTGIPTFIEKPMAVTIADAERLRDAAHRSGAAIFLGHVRLHNPAFQALLELLPALGAVRYVLCEGMNNNARTDSSVLWDWLPHDLSTARAMFGRDAASVAAWNLSGLRHPQAAMTRFLFGGVPVISTVSWHAPLPRQQMTISAERGTLVFDDKADRKLALHGEGGAVSYPAYGDELPLTREMNAFLDMIRAGKSGGSHIDAGVTITRMIAAADVSVARGGEPVPVAYR